MQKTDLLNTIPVVIISNSGQTVEIDRVLSLGVRDYLIKADFTPQDVLIKVKQQIGEGNIETKLDSKIKDPHILIVEDDKFLRGLLVRKLELENFKIAIASNGKEMFEKVREEKPRLILLDLILPDIDGFQILEILKKDEKTKDIPVLILSNLGQKDDIEKCLGMGAIDYLIKAHFTPKDIIQKVKALIGE